MPTRSGRTRHSRARRHSSAGARGPGRSHTARPRQWPCYQTGAKRPQSKRPSECRRRAGRDHGAPQGGVVGGAIDPVHLTVGAENSTEGSLTRSPPGRADARASTAPAAVEIRAECLEDRMRAERQPQADPHRAQARARASSIRASAVSSLRRRHIRPFAQPAQILISTPPDRTLLRGRLDRQAGGI